LMSATIKRYRSHRGQNKARIQAKNKLIKIKTKKLMNKMCSRFINYSFNKLQKY